MYMYIPQQYKHIFCTVFDKHSFIPWQTGSLGIVIVPPVQLAIGEGTSSEQNSERDDSNSNCQ